VAGRGGDRVGHVVERAVRRPQVTAAKDAGMDPTLLAAGNSSGVVLGKMISPQNLAIGAAAVDMAGQEGDLFRKVLKWSLLLVLIMCVLVYLQSTAVLDWMVVK
jgi:lactate permease